MSLTEVVYRRAAPRTKAAHRIVALGDSHCQENAMSLSRTKIRWIGSSVKGPSRSAGGNRIHARRFRRQGDQCEHGLAVIVPNNRMRLILAH